MKKEIYVNPLEKDIYGQIQIDGYLKQRMEREMDRQREIIIYKLNICRALHVPTVHGRYNKYTDITNEGKPG